MARVARDQSVARRRISARADRGRRFARRGVRRQTRWSRGRHFHAPMERRLVLARRVGSGRLYPPNRGPSRRARPGCRTAQVCRASHGSHGPQAAFVSTVFRETQRFAVITSAPDSFGSPTSRLTVATTRPFPDRRAAFSRVSTKNQCTDSTPAASAALGASSFFRPTC